MLLLCVVLPGSLQKEYGHFYAPSARRMVSTRWSFWMGFLSTACTQSRSRGEVAGAAETHRVVARIGHEGSADRRGQHFEGYTEVPTRAANHLQGAVVGPLRILGRALGVVVADEVVGRPFLDIAPHIVQAVEARASG